MLIGYFVAVDFLFCLFPHLGLFLIFIQWTLFSQQLTIANPSIEVGSCINLPSPCWSWIRTYLGFVLAVTNTVNSYWSCPAVSRCFPVDTHHLWLWYSPPHLHQWALGWGMNGESGRWGEWLIPFRDEHSSVLFFVPLAVVVYVLSTATNISFPDEGWQVHWSTTKTISH